jgi:abequosyltransferase
VINSKLAIAIPTYNRAEIVRDSICSIIDEVKEHSIPIYVSDNSSNDDTESIIGELKKRYEFIFYYKNTDDLGHDKNSFYVAQLPESDYVWLLGDSLLLKEGTVKNILGTIEKHKPGIISVNTVNRDLDKESGLYTDSNAVLDDFGWHITLTGATIYSRAALSNINQVDPQSFKNFPQLSLIFNFLSKDCSFFWDNNKWIESSPQKKGYWVSTMFSIFIDDWSRAIRNLPETYSQEIKEKVIIEHSHKSNIFGFKALLKAKFLGAYNFATYKKYRSELSSHSKLSSLILLFIAFFPKVILKILFQLKTYKILAYKVMFSI